MLKKCVYHLTSDKFLVRCQIKQMSDVSERSTTQIYVLKQEFHVGIHFERDQ